MMYNKYMWQNLPNFGGSPMNKRDSRIIRVYDFYSNEEQSRGFDSGIFKNGISEEWLMGRLQRAIYD